MIATKILLRSLVGLLLLLPTPVQAGPVPPVNDEQNLADQDQAAPVVIYHRSATAPCFADYVPDAEEVLAPFAVKMARNEYEPMQVALYVPGGATALKDVRIEVHATVPSTIGHLYYQPKEELSWVGDLDTDRGEPWEGKRDAMPQVVIPRNRIVAIEPARNGVFWITFKTDETVLPGIHRGSIEVFAADKLLRTVPLLIRVHPFSLPRPKITYGLYFFPYRLDPRFQSRALQEVYLADLAAHGMNTMLTTVDYRILSDADYDQASSTPHQEAWYSPSSRRYTGNYMAPGDYAIEGEYNVIKFIDAQLAMGREAGLIHRDHPLITQPNDHEVEGKKHVAAALKTFGEQKGWPDMILYMRDEPGPDIFAKVVDHVSQWKREGVKTTCAMSPLAAFAVGHVHDLWIVHAGYITRELQREAARLGAKLSTYSFSLRTTNAEAGRYYSGLYTWSLGLAANTSYNYVWLPSKGPGLRKQAFFDDQWKLSKPASLGHIIPSPAGPVPGVGFEGRREGVDDYRTLQLLEARIAAAAKDDPVAVAARRWLDRLRTDTFWPGFLPTYSFTEDFVDPHPGLAATDYDAIRAKAAAFIMRLAAAEGEENREPAEVQRTESFPLESVAFENQNLEDCLLALESGTVKQKRQAAAALARREPVQAAPACSLLIDLLDVPEVRIVALRALANLGPAAISAIPKLRELLEDADAFVRIGATFVLTRIGPEATELLAQCKDDPSFPIVNLATETLDGWEKAASP